MKMNKLMNRYFLVAMISFLGLQIEFFKSQIRIPQSLIELIKMEEK